MHKLTKNLIILTALLLFFSFSYNIVNGKVENAPGQNKSVEKTNNKKAIIGSLENIGTSSITIGQKNNNKKSEATIDVDTKIVGQDKKELKLGALKLKQLIALISTDSGNISTDGGKLKIKKVFVKEASESAQTKRRAVQGVITEINGNVITLAHQIHRERTYTVIVNSETYIQSKSSVSSTSATLSASDSAVSSLSGLQVGQRIVAVGDLDQTGGIIAKRIHIIPGKATGIFKKNPLSTPSASLIATPSAIATSSASPVLNASPSGVASATPIL